MNDITISIQDKTYRSRHVDDRQHQAIADLQLSVGRNEFVCLLGPSGCGKTTLLNMIAGLDSHYQGQIRIGSQAASAKIGYVFQNPRLLPWYTVRQNIEVVFAQTPPATLIDALLADMQLSDVQQVYPERLSLGMQRRVAIIRAFAINPDILLMDEPFVSLDAPSARQVRNLLYSLWQQRPHTVLFVSHDLREAIALADRLIFLSPPPMRIISDIPVNIPRELRNDETEIEAFREHLLNQHPAINGLL
ncbi:ABC transporter ATP-binding protein [Methylomonas sp. MK1]|uniref:ABC transporter ATP-binding protein n=1 Tax=Methylomonas sp. MK1 TaxID=1131552 RepID=UPI00035EA8B7|nr:ATP-binding cassette domain-containing protein [Methylomonas sp. MK1]